MGRALCTVHPACTIELLTLRPRQLRQEGVEAYKKEGSKFMLRLVAKRKNRVK